MLEGVFYLDGDTDSILFNSGCNDITIEGQGAATILKVPDGHTTINTLIKITGTAENHLHDIKIKNLVLDGNKSNVTGDAYNGISGEYADRVTVDNVTIKSGRGTSSGYGIIFQNGYDITIKNCFINPWGNTDIEFRTSDRINVSGNSFIGASPLDGYMEIYSNCNRITVSDNIFYQAGFKMGSFATPYICDGVSITGNNFHAPVEFKRTGGCFGCGASKNVIISNNNVNVCGVPVVIGSGTDGVTVCNNYIKSSYCGCLAFDSSDNPDHNNILIQGNTLVATSPVANRTFCIETSANSNLTGLTIKNNILQKDPAALGEVYGINLLDGESVRIESNDIRDFDIGVYIGAGANLAQVKNNFYLNNDVNIDDDGTGTVIA
mgnify:CR=1 FL=1